MKQIIKWVLNLIPFKPHLIRFGALLPPLFKGTHTISFFQYLQSLCPEVSSVALVTNFGMSTTYRILLNDRTNAIYLFGSVEQYAGERGSLHLCRELLGQCKGFLDIGAHRGYYTFFMRTNHQDRPPIYYMEPEPALFTELQHNCRQNKLKNVFGFRQAMGRVSGKTTFYLNRTDPYSSSLSRSFEAQHEIEAVEVACTRFDEFVQQHQLSNLCVKVDVEHAEFDFLEGAEQEAECISYLIIEVLGPAIAKGFINEARKQLQMAAYYINDYRLEYSADGTFSYVSPQYNWLFCRHEPEVLQDILRHTRFTVIK